MLWDHTRCDRTHLGGGWRNNLGERMFLVFEVTITPGVIGHIWGGGGRNNLGTNVFGLWGDDHTRCDRASSCEMDL